MKLTTKKKEAFLQLLKGGMPVIHACTKASISNYTMYTHRKDNADFAQQWASAVEQGEKVILDKLEAEADRRAMDGYLKPVYHNGAAVGAERRYSDVLLIVRLKALAPHKYKERPPEDVHRDDADDWMDRFQRTGAHRATFKGNGKAKSNGRNGST